MDLQNLVQVIATVADTITIIKVALPYVIELYDVVRRAVAKLPT